MNETLSAWLLDTALLSIVDSISIMLLITTEKSFGLSVRKNKLILSMCFLLLSTSNNLLI